MLFDKVGTRIQCAFAKKHDAVAAGLFIISTGIDIDGLGLFFQ